MKKVIVLIAIFLTTTLCFAGKDAVVPSALLLNSDKIELINATFIWGADPIDNICRVAYKVWSNDRASLIREIVFDISFDDFTTLVSGYGATMESRLETSIWQDIQTRFELVP